MSGRVAPTCLSVDRDALGVALTSLGDEWSRYFDLRTGEARISRFGGFREEADELSGEEVDAGVADGYLLLIEPLPASVEHGWMEAFAGSVADPRLRERLAAALQGRRPFRRFKDVLLDHPGPRERWSTFRDTRLKEAVEEWLTDHGIEQIVPAAEDRPNG